MNQATLDAIEFLSHPELDFVTNPTDVELLNNPGRLQQAVRDMLSALPAFMINQESAQESTVALQARLDEVDWPLVAAEFRKRLRITSQFFEVDAHVINQNK